MYRTWSELLEGCLVRCARVALVFLKAILGPFCGRTDHEAVTGVLGKYAGSHYLMHCGIALDYGLAGDIHIRAPIAVHKEDAGGPIQVYL